jgi:basic amino acid/polyamine antiporter, APA family
VVISFVLAGLAAAFTAICYAELAAMIPIAGSTYSYAYAAFGVFLAWFIGWDLLLEYLFAASTVAVGWAGYAVSFLGTIGIDVPNDIASPPFGSGSGVLNLPALVVVAATTALLVVGTRQSAGVNNAIVALKIVVLLLFVAVGAFAVDSSNWTPFVPANEGASAISAPRGSSAARASSSSPMSASTLSRPLPARLAILSEPSRWGCWPPC